MSIRNAKPEHEATYQELTALIRRHSDEMTSLEVLAIAANMVGKLIAMQDQRTVTPGSAMEVVIRNIEYGNQQVLAEISNTQGAA